LLRCEKLQDIRPLAWLPNLEILDLSYCKTLSKLYPISGLKKLKKLKLTLPHNDLQFLQDLKQLKELRFYECPKLSRLNLLARLQKLETLSFCDCDLVTDAMIDELKKKLPKSCKVSW